jgi:hypothetical protein
VLRALLPNYQQNLHLELIHSKGQEIRKNSQKINNIERGLHKLELAGGAGQTD